MASTHRIELQQPSSSSNGDERPMSPRTNHIKASGRLSRSCIGQILTGFNPLEEMQLMQATIDSVDLGKNYTAIYNALAVVAGLCLAFSVRKSSERVEISTDINTIWGTDPERLKFISNLSGFFQNIVTILAYLTIAQAVFMSIMLSQIPANQSTRFFEMVGIVRTQSIFVFTEILLLLFVAVALLNSSMVYSAWVTYATIGSVVGVVFVKWLLQNSIQPVRIELLRKVYEGDMGQEFGQAMGSKIE